MSIHHMVRCEAEGCKAEASLVVDPILVQRIMQQSSVATAYPDPTLRPSSWFQAEKRDFCSWKCLSTFAASMIDTANCA